MNDVCDVYFMQRKSLQMMEMMMMMVIKYKVWHKGNLFLMRNGREK